jgi:hypothetical protein
MMRCGYVGGVELPRVFGQEPDSVPTLSQIFLATFALRGAHAASKIQLTDES